MIITTTTVTPTPTAATIFTNHNRTEDRKPSGLSWPPPTESNKIYRNRPLCKKCTLHHTGPCTVKWAKLSMKPTIRFLQLVSEQVALDIQGYTWFWFDEKKVFVLVEVLPDFDVNINEKIIN
ncbi:hypothetical protein Tco_0523568 [Tanacetum coccineum]